MGKSSLLNAGVVYKLKEISQQNLRETSEPEFAVVFFKAWQDDPVMGLLRQVQRAVGEERSRSDAWHPSSS